MYNAEYLICHHSDIDFFASLESKKKVQCRQSVPKSAAQSSADNQCSIKSKISESKCLNSKPLTFRARHWLYIASVRKQTNYKIKESKYTMLKIHLTASPTLTYSLWQNPKKVSIRTHIRIRINISIRKIITSKDTMLNAVLSIDSGADFSHFPRIPKEFQNVNVSVQCWIPHFATSQTLTSWLR